MELYDEKVEDKKSKLPKIIEILVGILIFITCIIIGCIIYLQSSLTIINIDGQRNNQVEEIFHFEQTGQETELYIPIIKMSEFLGYEGFRGDYENKSEDKNKCHVTSENEVAMLTLNSNLLIKITENSEYEYIKIDKPVIEIEGELYTTVDGIEKAFNIIFSHDEQFKNINIFTLSYLIQYYTGYYKIEEYEASVNDQKAILEDMLIIQEEDKYGVLNVVTDEYVLEPKYELISYLPGTTDFLVKSNNKYGVVAKDTTTKIRTLYDEIIMMDAQNGLYLVKKNNTYGIVNLDGKVIIEPEYKQIGISNIDEYSQNGIENQYVLLDKIIPIQNNEGFWGLFNLKGEKVSEFQYTGIGCETVPTNNAYPTVVIPSHEIIVVEKDERYNLVNIKGEQMISGYILDSVYLKSDSATEQNQFFMTSNNNTKVINIEEWLTSIGG